jgi:putative ABC transport system substrate-binding protein
MTIADDPRGQSYVAALQEALQKLGWAEGRNVRIDTRWPAGNADRTRAYAAELVELQPDVILSGATSALAPLQQATRTIEREPSSCRPCAKSVTL